MLEVIDDFDSVRMELTYDELKHLSSSFESLNEFIGKKNE